MKTFIAKSINPIYHPCPICHPEPVEGSIGIQSLEFYQQILRIYKSQGIDLPCTQKAVELIEKQLRQSAAVKEFLTQNFI